MTKYEIGQHPNSLKNLSPSWTTESAREAQKKSVESRKANKEAREQLALTAAELKLDIEAVMEKNDLSSLGVLKLAMLKAIQADDYDTAADLAKTLAEFEAPKLARIESTVEEVNASDMTDEELEAALAEVASSRAEPPDVG